MKNAQLKEENKFMKREKEIGGEANDLLEIQLAPSGPPTPAGNNMHKSLKNGGKGPPEVELMSLSKC